MDDQTADTAKERVDIDYQTGTVWLDNVRVMRVDRETNEARLNTEALVAAEWGEVAVKAANALDMLDKGFCC